jgi:hypothetical protein
MLLRNAAIAVLVATSPIAAAGQVSEATKAWWPRLAGATAQLIILKPVIALVFCVGLSLTGTSDDVETLLSGMLVLVLAVLAWPAVARFFVFASVHVGGGTGLGALIGFAAGRMGANAAYPTGVEPDEFSRRVEARTMAGLEGSPLSSAPSPGAAGAFGVGRAAGAGPAGLAATAATAAQRAANALTGRMEQMAGNAGLQGANPYAQPAGPPHYAGHPVRRAAPVPAEAVAWPAPGRSASPPPPTAAPPPGSGWTAQQGPHPEPEPPPESSGQAYGQPPAPAAPAPPEVHHEPRPRPGTGDDGDGGAA